MTLIYIQDESKVLYWSKDGEKETILCALGWLSAICPHLPSIGEQMVCFFFCYSNVSHGRRQKEDQDGLILCIIEKEENAKHYRKIRARLIQEKYRIDSLTQPKCQGENGPFFSVRVSISCGTSYALKISVYCYDC